MELPFLIASFNLKDDSCIKVYQLAADKLMEDISPVASHVKNIHLGHLANELICNELFFGCVLGDGQAVVLIEKKALFDAAIPPERTERNHVVLQEDTSKYSVDMNTTSLVFAMWEKGDEDKEEESEEDEDLELESNEDKEEEGEDLEELNEEDQEQGYREEKDEGDESDEYKVVTPLHKKDFWMTNNIV